VIGHEMGHGFDDQGAKSMRAACCALVAAADEAAFKSWWIALADQYSGYTAMPGLISTAFDAGREHCDLGG